MKLALPKNKWLLAFIIAAVVALAAIVVAIVIGVTSATPDAPPYVEGNEVGVYYYDAMDQEVLLTLSGGNIFTISGTGINKTGTYTVDGATITLDFFKDEDGTAKATISGDTVTLAYNNATMSFLKKINYTVSFNANGGTAINSVTVVNGKTLEKPADPTKENAVFLGWYADEALTTPYAFNTATVKADTTLYAKWVEKTVGGSEYTVDFDLGYEGGVTPDAVTTLGGKVYGLPAPQREGYTFGGWWISMYEDGAKLSFACTADTVFKANTTLFAVWYDNASTKLNAPAVSIGANTISWNAVEGAASYKLTVIDPNGDTVIDNETVGTTTKAFDFAAGAAGEYKITVTAIASNEANNSEPATRYFANKALDRVCGFHVENGILIFGAVENAQKYIITIDCGNDDHVHTAFDNGASTTFYMANCPMQKGGILITVQAVADGYASSTSKVFAYDKTLAKIDEIAYNAEKDQFVWNAVPGTANYRVTITVGGTAYTVDNGTATVFSTAGYTGELVISVLPVAEGYNSPTPTIASCKKTAPAAPAGLTAVGTVISWNAVEGATSYEVSIGTQTATVTTNQLDLAGSALTLTQGETYAVKVKAINASNESSAYSATVEMSYFAMVKAPTYAKNTVSWTPVLGVSRYQVRVNGGEAVVVDNANSLKVALTKEGENLIEVRYIHNDTTSEWVSVTVTAYAVEYDTRSLAFGVCLVEYLAVGDEMTMPNAGFTLEGYIFSGWYNAPKGAAGNGKLYAAGSTFAGNAYTVVYAEWTPREYSVTLKTDGFNITNIENNKIEHATYTKHFQLSVPHVEDAGMYFFAGWYTGPSGTGIKLTDETGASVAPYPFTRNIDLYPYYSTNALSFELQDDGTYAVKKGDSIASVTNLVIPVTYNEIPVTKILESAFSSCSSLITVSIPDTITLVGTSAFNGCTNLTYIDVYVAKPEEEGRYETFYSSDKGVLLRRDVGDIIYLEFVPRAMTGEYRIPASVEKITPKAFYYSKLSSIIVPNTVASLPDFAFYYCSSLTNFVIEGNRTAPLEMSKKMFNYCNNIESLTFPATLNTELSDLKSMFDSLDNLKSIVIEDGGTDYGSVGGMLTNKEKNTILYCPRAYAGALSIPQGITTIGERAFYYCDQITSLTIPVWVTNIMKEAFYFTTGIKDIVFKGSRAGDLTIGERAFSFISGLETVAFEGNGSDELDTGKVMLGNQAFSGSKSSSKLHTVTIGAGVNIPTIAEKAFQNNSKLQNLVVETGAFVGVIGKNAFEACTMLTKLTVPATVTKIDQYAFSGCTDLATVEFATEGATTLEIADYAFNGCAKLTAITLPDHLKAFQSSAFEGCDALKRILVNSTNKNYINDANGILYKKGANDTLAELLFYPKGLVKENGGVINNLPATLTTIGGAAFSGNNYLVSITIPATVTVIGNSAFANCANLETILFEQAATASDAQPTLEIGEKAFFNCSALTDSFKLPSYTVNIGAAAFQGCEFTTFVIPESVTVIGKAAFWGCQKLETVEFKCTGALNIVDGTANNATNGGAFSNCPALKSVALPKGTTDIGKYAFYKCYALETVTIGNVTTTTGANGETVYHVESDLVRIGNYAFAHCPLIKTIVIPNTVTALGTSAFQMTQTASSTNPGPGSLESVIFELGGTEMLNLGSTVFTYQPNLKSITFPARTNLYVSTATTMKDSAGKAMKDANGNSIYEPSTADEVKSPLLKGLFTGCTALAELNIAVEEGITPYYASVDGVIYTADKTALIFCPFANVGTYKNGEPTYELIVPTSVKVVFTYAFLDCTELKTLTFAEFDKADSNYGKQLLTLGNYAYTSATAKTYGTIGGKVSSIATINLPSHLAQINYTAFANESGVPVSINFNMDASNVAVKDYAFNFSTVSALKLPNLSSIGKYAFANCALLETFEFTTLASSIKALPDYLFYQDAALTAFEIPAQITTVNQYAFYKCASITEFTIPQTVTKMGNYTLYGTGITSIVIPKSLTTAKTGLGTYMFHSCASLVSVTFELDATGKSPITKIPNYLFYGCTALTTINLCDLELTDIGSYAFYKCASLPDIDFTQFTKLKTIGANAFYQTNFEHVDLSKTQLTKLDTSFNNITSLKSIVFPDKVTSVVAKAFTNDDSLETITLSPNFKGNMFYPTAATFIFSEVFEQTPYVQIVIPEDNLFLAVDQYGVVYDPSYQVIYFAGATTDLSGYQIPSTVLTISTYAFAYNETLGDFVITDGVETVGTYAFAYTTMTSVTLPKSVTELSNFAFYKSAISSVTFADGLDSKLTKIGNSVFYGTNLVNVVLPDSLVSVGTYTFYNCFNLKSVTTGAGMTAIPSGFVAYTPSLEELNMQEGIETISWIFSTYSYLGEYGLHKMTSIHIPASVKTLQANAFCDMRSLTTVTFAEGSQLETIAEHAFRQCTALENIVLPESVATLGQYAFHNCTALKALDLSNTAITTITEYAFENTENLATLLLPKNLETIETYAFHNTGIVDLTIPATVSTFGTSAFEDAKAMKSLTFAGDNMITSLGDAKKAINIFKGTTSLETVILPNFLQEIGTGVFENSAVSTAVLADPEGISELTTIGDYAFANCKNLTGFDYLGKVTAIGEGAFLNCVNLANTTTAEGLESMGAMAFAFCYSLNSAYIPSTVTELGGNPYAGLDKSIISLGANNEKFLLETDANGVVTLYDASQTIVYGVYGATGEYLLEEDPATPTYMPGALAGNAITAANVPATFGTVPAYLFMNCTQLASVSINEEITEIGKYAFYNTAIETITLPSVMKKIGDYAFAYCASLNNVTIPASVTSAGNYCFAYCTALSDFVFEEKTSTTTLGTHFFYNCINITEVILPAAVSITTADRDANGQSLQVAKVIPSYMFAGTGIVHAVIPVQVEYFFTSGVFANCKELISITIEKQPNSGSYPLNPTMVDGCDKYVGIYLDTVSHYMLYIAELMSVVDLGDLHIRTMDAEDTVEAFAQFTRVCYGNETLSIYFDTTSYMDLIPFFANVAYDWTVQIFDKDGNQLFCHENNGTIAYVVDTEGNVIWGEKPAENAAQ